MHHVIVVGAGLTGLTAAYQILRRETEIDAPLQVTLLESSAMVGGKQRARRSGARSHIPGSTTFPAASPSMMSLVTRLGLTPSLEEVEDDAVGCSAFYEDQIIPWPENPATLIRRATLSGRSKVRLLFESLQNRRSSDLDESLADFLSQQLGPELGLATAWILATERSLGHPDGLSARSVAPELFELVARHGGLLKAALFQEAEAKTREAEQDRAGFGALDQVLGLFAANVAESGMSRFQGADASTQALSTFRGGLIPLVEALQSVLGERILLKHKVEAVRTGVGGATRTYALDVITPDGPKEMHADQIVMACDPSDTATILAALDSPLSRALAGLQRVSVAQIEMAWHERPPFQTFGQRLILTPDAASPQPPGHVERLPQAQHPDEGLRLRLSFTNSPGLARLPAEDQLAEAASSLLRSRIGLQAAPDWVCPLPATSILQYAVGYQDALAEISRRTTLHPGLHLDGPLKSGQSAEGAVKSAYEMVEQLLLLIQHRQGRVSA